MRRCVLQSIAVVATLGAILSSLAAFPSLATARHSLNKIVTAGPDFSTPRGVTAGAVSSGQPGPAECAPFEGWLESRSEEEFESAVAADAGPVVIVGLDGSTTRQRRFSAREFGQHLAWNPAARAFSPSVHPIRC